MLATVRPVPFAFICYPRAVADYVKFLARGLGEQDIGVWYDADAPSGKRWKEEIADKLTTASAVIVVMANDAGDHEWIRREIDYAKNQNKKIMTLLLSGRQYPDLNQIQYERAAPDTMPPAPWTNELRRALYPPPAEQPPGRSWGRPPWRRIALGVAVALLAVAAFIATPHLAPDTAGEDACGGLAARIVSVSEERPGHTGLRPIISVIVCRAAANGHQYWLMNYRQEGDRRRFWAKTRVGGAVAPKTDYLVVHSDLTDKDSRRTYVVVDVPPAPADTLKGAPETSRYAKPGQESPPETPIVSNGVDGVL